MGKQILIPGLLAAAVAALVGWIWQALGLVGGPGPVYGIVFAVLFEFLRRSKNKKPDARK